MALVRYGDVGNEGALWAHEYGHNVGLGHNTDSRYIMYGCLCGNNYGLSASECNLYHTPLARRRRLAGRLRRLHRRRRR